MRILSRCVGRFTEARWQSGYAAACKAVYAGSIPTLASILPGVEPGKMKQGEITGTGPLVILPAVQSRSTHLR